MAYRKKSSKTKIKNERRSHQNGLISNTRGGRRVSRGGHPVLLPAVSVGFAFIFFGRIGSGAGQRCVEEGFFSAAAWQRRGLLQKRDVRSEVVTLFVFFFPILLDGR